MKVRTKTKSAQISSRSKLFSCNVEIGSPNLMPMKTKKVIVEGKS